MGSKSNRSRRYTEEFKRDAVALVRSSGKTVTEVAREIGVSAEGHRFHDWAVIDLAEVRPGSHRLPGRRKPTTGELAYYRCFSPVPVPLATLSRRRLEMAGGDLPA